MENNDGTLVLVVFTVYFNIHFLVVVRCRCRSIFLLICRRIGHYHHIICRKIHTTTHDTRIWSFTHYILLVSNHNTFCSIFRRPFVSWVYDEFESLSNGIVRALFAAVRANSVEHLKYTCHIINTESIAQKPTEREYYS